MRGKLEQIVLNAGELLLQAAKTGTAVHEKEGVGNFVTDCDIATQRFLQRELKALLPGAAFVGEEEDSEPYRNTGACWIVDPIDGTANFTRNLRYSAVSVGLVEGGVPRLGVVYNPFSGELFSAARGDGATLNQKPIHVSARPLNRSLVSFGATIYRRDVTERMFQLLRNTFDHCEDIRSCGSAALDICQIAAGRLDAFWELRLSPWDYVAAACILGEAGGRIGTMEGNSLTYDAPNSLLAGSDAVYAEMLALIKEKEL